MGNGEKHCRPIRLLLAIFCQNSFKKLFSVKKILPEYLHAHPGEARFAVGIRLVRLPAAALALMLLCASCSSLFNVSNNNMHCEDLIEHMVREGVPITKVQELEPRTVGAQRAFVITVKGKEVGIYKYDTNIKRQRKRIEQIKKEGLVYVAAIKFAAVVKGSFMLLGVGRNPDKEKILDALNSF